MRNTIAAVTVALAFAAAPIRAADPPRSTSVDVGLGRVAWFDITTSDLAQSRDFYGKLFDWTFAPVQGTDLAVQIVARDTLIGSLRVAEGAISGFNGVVYIQVADVVASSARAKELGGKVIPGFPFNLPDGTGAISLLLDPTGHPMGMYSRALISSKGAGEE
jgi:predicted enzyme related to lactoylglutathione lyase